MALLTVQAVTRTGTGLEPTYAAASAGGDTVRTGKSVFLHAKNGHSAEQTLTIATPGTTSGLAIADLAVAIPAGEERMVGPVDDVFRGANGLAAITYSGVTALTVAAIRI